ncbi:hypothetical protein [Micromonospora sp. NPDC003776]
MATFHQENQSVRHQVNGEYVFVRGGPLSGELELDRLIGDLLQTARATSAHPEVIQPTISYLEAARDATSRGDVKGVRAMLSKAAEVAAPVATLAASVASVASLVAGAQ